MRRSRALDAFRTLMDEFAGVLFQMRACDADTFFCAVGQSDIYKTILRDRLVKL
jgi:hypothetical protein